MRYFFILTFLFTPFCLQATVVPLQDRVLFSSTDSSKRLLIVNNDSRAPVLLQSWIDDGTSDDINREKNFPFVVIPAVANMQPGKIINLKILPTEKVNGLPRDRESVFWINLYEIPGVKKKPQLENANKMEVGLKTQLKITYRPFKSSMDIERIAKTLSIRVTNEGHLLEFYNPSPFYMTPVLVRIKSSSGEQSLKLGMNRMIAPFSYKRFEMSKIKESESTTIEYALIDDAGKDTTFTKVLK